MNGYVVPLTCPDCGSEMEHVVASKVCAGTECSAVARCVPCRREHHVTVAVRPMPRSSRFAK